MHSESSFARRSLSETAGGTSNDALSKARRWRRTAAVAAPVTSPNLSAGAPAALASSPTVQSSPASANRGFGVKRMLGREGDNRQSSPEVVPQSAAKGPQGTRVTGRIVRILFNDQATQKAMLLVEGEQGRFKLQGLVAFPAEVGDVLSATATLERHPKWGDQYNAELIIHEFPTRRNEVVEFLSKHLTPINRQDVVKLVDAFGESVYSVLQNEPVRLREFNFVSQHNYQPLVDAWIHVAARRNLWPMLANCGVPEAVCARIYTRFGPRTVQVATETPYLLTKVDGLSFAMADSIAATNNVAVQDDVRLAGAIDFALERAAQGGHTAMREPDLVEEVAKLTGLDLQAGDADLVAAIAQRVQSGDLVSRELNGKVSISLLGFAQAEASIAAQLARLSEAGTVDEALAGRARANAQSLGDADQANAVANVFESPVSVITGRPGCGKTTVVKIITKTAKAAGLKVVMAAPTGMAARRMTEATEEASSTVHSLLKPTTGGNLNVFQHGLHHPLEGDVFVIDESSMLDTLIARSYLEAIPSGARVVLVGDYDQLESVSAGRVFEEIISSGAVKVARLQTPHRTALDSDIVLNAHRVCDGDADAVQLDGRKDFKFLPALSEQSTRDTVQAHYLHLVGKHGVGDVQVLCAQNRTSVGVDALNELLRSVVNPPGPAKLEVESRGQVFRLGDRVMRTSNSAGLQVSNGDMGVITHIDPDSKAITIDFGRRRVLHVYKELSELKLGYAKSIHKSQGGEHSGVITVVPAAHRSMLTRKLIYTAMTRGKKESDIVGDPSVLRAAIAKLSPSRFTGLSAEIAAAFNKTSQLDQQAKGKEVMLKVERAPIRAYQPRPASPQQQHTAANSQSPERTSLFRRARP